MKRPSPLVASLVLAAQPLVAQQPPSPPVFSSEAEMVVVDVVVTDGKGLPVRGLTREDFVVKEDGVAQEIASFEAIDRPFATAATGTAGTPAAAPAVVSSDAGRPERTTVVVVFDEPHLNAITTEQVRRRLDDVWPTLGAANVLLASTSGGGTWVGRLPEDAAALQGALVRFKGGRNMERPGVVSDYEAYLIAGRRDEQVLGEVYRRYLDYSMLSDSNMAEKGPAGQQTERQKELPAAGRSMIVAEAEQRWSVVRRRQAATLAGLLRLLSGMAHTPGRKAVVLVSEGFIVDQSQLEHRALVEAARAARAAIHVIDPRTGNALGHDAESDDVAATRDLINVASRQSREAEGSDGLALATGGRIVRSLQALPATFGRIGSELRTYYLLGYSPPNARADGQYHKLKVELKRPDLKLEARPGYFALAPASQRAAREAPSTALQAALTSPFDAAGLPVQLAAFVLGQGAGGGTVVRLVAEVDASSVAKPETLDAVFQLAQQSESAAQQSTVSAPVAAGSGARIRMEKQFEVPPGAYQVRVAVRERGGPKRVGSVLQPVAVQPPTAFHLTTPILTDVLLPDQSPLARAERRFARGSTLHCLVEVVGAAGRPVEAGVEVRSADGRTVAQIPDSVIASQPPSRHWKIPLADLEAGAYELVISVKDQTRGQDLKSRQAFEVVAAAS